MENLLAEIKAAIAAAEVDLQHIADGAAQRVLTALTSVVKNFALVIEAAAKSAEAPPDPSAELPDEKTQLTAPPPAA